MSSTVTGGMPGVTGHAAVPPSTIPSPSSGPASPLHDSAKKANPLFKNKVTGYIPRSGVLGDVPTSTSMSTSSTSTLGTSSLSPSTPGATSTKPGDIVSLEELPDSTKALSSGERVEIAEEPKTEGEVSVKSKSLADRIKDKFKDPKFRSRAITISLIVVAVLVVVGCITAMIFSGGGAAIPLVPLLCMLSLTMAATTVGSVALFKLVHDMAQEEKKEEDPTVKVTTNPNKRLIPPEPKIVVEETKGPEETAPEVSIGFSPRYKKYIDDKSEDKGSFEDWKLKHPETDAE